MHLKKLFFLFAVTIVLTTGCEQSSDSDSSTPAETTPEYRETRAYHVGTKYYQWLDSSREDLHYGGQRAVEAQVWYPTVDTAAESASYLPHIDGTEDFIPWTSREKRIAMLVRSGSFLNAKPMNGSFPLLVFSPDEGGHSAFGSWLAEAFIREGYIVMGINHLHESAFIMTPDGTLHGADLSFHDSLRALQIPEQITPERFRLVQGQRSTVLAKDIIFAIDELFKVNDTDFGGSINEELIGVWGNVLGGTAAIDAARIDVRIKAVVNYDGMPSGQAFDQGMRQPFMLIEGKQDYGRRGFDIIDERRTFFCEHVDDKAYRIQISGARNKSLRDLTLHMASGARNSSQALNFLQTCQSYMSDFYRIHVRDEVDSIITLDSDSLTVIIYP